MTPSNGSSKVNWIKQPETICQYIRASERNVTVDITSHDLADPDIAGVGVNESARDGLFNTDAIKGHCVLPGHGLPRLHLDVYCLSWTMAPLSVARPC